MHLWTWLVILLSWLSANAVAIQDPPPLVTCGNSFFPPVDEQVPKRQGLQADGLYVNNELQQAIGLGFSFAAGYGTASARFRNGTTVDIAKVAGGPAFTQYMLSMNEETFACNLATQEISLQSWSHWTWTPQVDSVLLPMFKALKTAAEATLESKVADVLVSFSHLPSSVKGVEALKADVKSALKQASMRSVRVPLDASKFAALAMGPRSHCPDPYQSIGAKNDPPQLIFTMENTKQELTLTLLEEECDLYEVLRQVSSSSLGQASMDRCREIEGGAMASCDRELASAIRNVTRRPFEGAYAKHSSLSAVVVFGEGSHDSNTHRALKRVLREQYWFDLPVTIVGTAPVDATFAASEGVAYYHSGMRPRDAPDEPA